MKKKYKPVFPTVKITTYHYKFDANYFSIKQKLRKIGIDLFKRIRRNNLEELIEVKIKFTVWQKYSIWWNKHFTFSFYQDYCIWFNKKYNKVKNE